VSLAIWDHTVLPATLHKWTHPAFTPASQAGTQFTYPGGMEGWVDQSDLLHTEMVYPPADGHPYDPSANRARCRLTSLIKPTPLTTIPRIGKFSSAWKPFTLIYDNSLIRVVSAHMVLLLVTRTSMHIVLLCSKQFWCQQLYVLCEQHTGNSRINFCKAFK